MRSIGDLSYDPKNVVGRGAFGNVFSGLYRKSFPVAIKQIMKYHVKYDSQEIEIMMRAGEHRNILRCLCTEMNDDFL